MSKWETYYNLADMLYRHQTRFWDQVDKQKNVRLKRDLLHRYIRRIDHWSDLVSTAYAEGRLKSRKYFKLLDEAEEDVEIATDYVEEWLPSNQRNV